MNKMQYVHTMEYYLAIGKNIHAMTWMKLKTTQSGSVSPQRPHIIGFHSYESPEHKSVETESGLVVSKR